MTAAHKNKTLATLLAALAGCLGAHRFYLGGKRDRWAWLHLSTLPLSALIAHFYFNLPALLSFAPLILSYLAATLQALVLGLTPDQQWDLRYNAGSGRRSEAHWPLALLLVLTAASGALVLIAVLARSFDLLYTGGAYG